MTILDFPLVWRWTDTRYTVFPPDVLTQLSPCSADEASRHFERAVALSRPEDAVAPRICADAPQEQVSAWLRARKLRLIEDVTVCWSAETALRTHWTTFTERWDDFCYPSSDDVTILPDSGSWILMYHHWNEFEFRDRTAANQAIDTNGDPQRHDEIKP